MRTPRIFALYLPAYHPIPENDEQWGLGFTEWHNVTASRPRFTNHYQPHVPADLGYYDLRLPETRSHQATLAREHGIAGFIYYHYWFGGRTLFETPLNEVLRMQEPDFPFAICWANEPWTRRWDGLSQDVFVPQVYSAEDDSEHIEALLPMFEDERYICVDGRPLVLVYRASDLPDSRRTADIWRSSAKASGFSDIYLGCMESAFEPRSDPTVRGFDFSVEFQPNFLVFAQLREEAGRHSAVVRDDYRDYVNRVLRTPTPGYKRAPGVCPSWDNSARAPGSSFVLSDPDPDIFRDWICKRLQGSDLRGDEDMLFVNAWNEWGEGCHLEPDRRYGHAWLEAVASALQSI